MEPVSNGTNLFTKKVSDRVAAYFAETGLPNRANWKVHAKGLLFIGLYLALYFTAINASGAVPLFMLCFAAMGFLQICIVLTISHDASHNSYSRHRAVNMVLLRLFDLIGANGYIWRLRHVVSHHPNTNYQGRDVDIHISPWATFAPAKKKKWRLKYRHYYLPFLYLFYTFNAMWTRDFRDMFTGNINAKKIDRHPWYEWVLFFGLKAFYVWYIFLVPLWYSGCAWYVVAAAHLVMQFACSFAVVISLIPAHLFEDVNFPDPANEKPLQYGWQEHQLRVTMDYATANPAVEFLFGSINYHVGHHMFPGISQVHSKALQKIVKETAEALGITYNHQPTLRAALRTHLRMVKQNGIYVIRETMLE